MLSTDPTAAPSRRHVLALAPAASLAAIAASAGQGLAAPSLDAPTPRGTWRAFIRSMGLMHPNGAAVAGAAFAAGMDLQHLSGITLAGRGAPDSRFPEITFTGPGLEGRTFRP